MCGGNASYLYDVGKANMPVEVGDARRVFLIRTEYAENGMPLRENVVEMVSSGEAARNKRWDGAHGSPGGRQEARAEEQTRFPSTKHHRKVRLHRQ
jgi:hypothetical protein